MLSRRIRRAVLTVHIVASVSLLGVIAAEIALNVRALTAEPALADSAYELMTVFPLLFGIPFSMTSLATGLVLGLTSKWGILRYRWVTIKLVLLLSVIGMGAGVLGPQTAALADGTGGSETALVVASMWDVLALSLATFLSVYKPGSSRRARPST